MTAVVVTILCLIGYVFAYRFYAGFLSRKIFGLSDEFVTPAHTLEDGIDYVPSNRYVLFGHHYASITGLSPMLGPAIAVIWGWLPGLLWVVFGAVFVGCVHDFGSLVISMRARGMSIGKVAEGIIGKRAKTLFHLIIFFLISLVLGVFISVVASLFMPGDGPENNPEAILPTGVLMGLAVLLGFLIYKRGYRIWPVTAVAFVIMLFVVWAGNLLPIIGPSQTTWSWLLIGYAFLASVLPVWMLLQSRDFINSLLLYLGLILMYAGFFLNPPEFVAPAIDLHPQGAPPIFPFVFIVIACGAASGFHSLVSSGTSSKQINLESDARFIGYGGMVGESLLGLIAVLACTAGILRADLWAERYASWQVAGGLGAKLGAFIGGATNFVTNLGIPRDLAGTFIALVVVSFALTSVDTAMRILRYNIAEMGETIGLAVVQNRYIASALAVVSVSFFTFYEIGGHSAGQHLWELFGTTNQLLAGLALLAVTVYLIQRKRPSVYTLVPMLFMLVTTLSAMVFKLFDFLAVRSYALFFVGSCLFVLAIWLAVEAALSVLKSRARGPVLSLQVEFAAEETP